MAMSDGIRLSEASAATDLFFPTADQVPESKRHLKLRTLLYQVLELAFADQAEIGCDQFVYWDATDPRVCLAPDAFVHLGQADTLFDSWKTWERGTPEIAVEIISKSDERDRDWEAKLGRYNRLGVRELIRFDPEATELRLRVWDLSDGRLVERVVVGDSSPSRWLPGHWLVLSTPELGPSLRLSHDAGGARLYPTPTEHALEQGAQRVRELEAELKRRGTS